MDNTYPITSNNFQFTHLRCCIPAGTCTKVAILCAAAEIWRKSGKSEKFTEDQKQVSNISSDKFILINYNDQFHYRPVGFADILFEYIEHGIPFLFLVLRTS